MLKILCFLFGALLGSGIFSGQVANVFGIEQIWIYNPSLNLEMLYLNVITMGIIYGLSFIGILSLITPT